MKKDPMSLWSITSFLTELHSEAEALGLAPSQTKHSQLNLNWERKHLPTALNSQHNCWRSLTLKHLFQLTESMWSLSASYLTSGLYWNSHEKHLVIFYSCRDKAGIISCTDNIKIFDRGWRRTPPRLGVNNHCHKKIVSRQNVTV